MSKKLGAQALLDGAKYRFSYTSSASIQVPVRRQSDKMALCSSRLRVQPVGLLGALTISNLVRGVMALQVVRFLNERRNAICNDGIEANMRAFHAELARRLVRASAV